MKTKDIRYLTEAASIAAIYIVLTYLAWGFDLASGAIQCRISEALTVLPFFTPAAIPGLSIGCVLANFLTGAPLPDVIFGSLATLLGACGSYVLRKNRYLVSIPPVIANALIIPFVLRFSYGAPDLIAVFANSAATGTWIEDGSLAMGNLMNAAHAIGVASCWINRARQTFDSPEGRAMATAWGIPESYKGIGYCILGYADGDEPLPKPRKEDFVVYVD